ncbi:MAG: hypothetical protein GWM98_11190 [Nitrospinaceae bacterium]|nr:hypothetical protein [Nitrospinaceae bacterium]NIR54961.1 hypothetical protein [Nitrospinaceae bacterium]NIS85374.1 hypothetical protein [Nitrospinaceae bacterium]NIT82201.1 hypothetical protein [Nitrospinaceae bacterium]NIU44445.1 hypothetical protein [Nitrospinaceae bacterium]
METSSGQLGSSEILLPQPELETDLPEDTMVQLETSGDMGPRFTLSAQEADIQNVLLALSREIQQNFVMDPQITQKVTLDLKNVTLQEALEHILKPLRLDYKIEGRFVKIFRQKMKTRMFRMNYIISRRAGSSNLRSTSGQGTAAGSSVVGVQNPGLLGLNNQGQNAQGVGRTSTNLFTSEETDLWREIFHGLRRIVTGADTISLDASQFKRKASVPGQTRRAAPGGRQFGKDVAKQSGSGVSAKKTEAESKEQRGYFSISRQSGLVIVKDYPDVLLQVAEFLEAVEGSAQRQVFIMAKIMEVSLNEQFQLGIDWSKVNPLNILHDNDPGIFQDFPDTFNLSRVPGVNQLGTFVTGQSGLFYGISNTQINVVIDALQEQGNVSVLSSPKIATLNNQRAVIKVGKEDIFFLPQVIPATTTTAATTQFIPSSLTIGIVLDVLPQINADGKVMMSINTSVSERVGERISPDGTNAVPVLDVRESNNVVMASSGQTIVIGGLMKNTRQRNKDDVPFLSKIPILGYFFQHWDDADQKTELVIMLTPQVVAGDSYDKLSTREIERIDQYMEPFKWD